jgi:integrase
LANCSLDAITAERIAGFVATRREAGLQVSTINRHLEVLRRMLQLASERHKVEKALPKVEMLPGENRRDRVLNEDEEARYLDAATEIGEDIQVSYRRAFAGTRATVRGEKLRQPEDPFLLRDSATVLIDCGLRPQECFRLRWEHSWGGAVHIPFWQNGKRAANDSLNAQDGRATRNAASGEIFRVGLSCTDGQWAYREIQFEKAASEAVQTGAGSEFPALYVPPSLLDAVGWLHGPVHAWISCRP